MADIGKGNQATAYPGSIDIDTPLANCSGTPCVGGDGLIAGHVNNPAGAVVAIETALGITPQGTAASVAARLAIMLANDGGMPRGTSFPISPVNVPQFFYRTDQNLVYYFNTQLGSFVQLLTAAALTPYVPIASPVVITAQHTFNPSIVEAPFILGANALAQKVAGLKADTVAQNPDTAGLANGVATLTAGSQVVQDGQTVQGKAPAAANGLATLDAGSLVVQNPTNASASPSANKIPIEDASGTLNSWATITPGVSKIPLSGANSRLDGWGTAAPTANALAQFDASARMNTNAPAFSVQKVSAQTPITSATPTKVILNSVDFDTNSNYDAVTNYRFTPTIAGKYLIQGLITFSDATTATDLRSMIYKNGSIYAVSELSQSLGASVLMPVPVSAIVDMNGTTDYIELFGQITGTGTLQFAGSSSRSLYLSGVRVSI